MVASDSDSGYLTTRERRVPSRDSMASPAPNQGLQATANSLCSCLAVRRESGVEECGNTFGYTGTQ